MSGEVCGDNRFEIIERCKKRLIEATNIESRPDEMAVLDSVLYRCWQMGWLRDTARWVPGREISRECIGDITLSICYDGFTCSACGYLIDRQCSGVLFKFCPECGAKMRTWIDGAMEALSK